jgi:sulfoxide reductase catalytic subunit YedY
MPNIVIRPSWYLPEDAATSESAFHGRREFLRSVGIGGLMLAGVGCGPSARAQEGAAVPALDTALPAITKNAKFADAGRPLTDIKDATSFNNFYEFGLNKEEPAKNAKGFKLDPYVLKVDGLVSTPLELDLDAIEVLGVEERVYRFRCVEAWGMTVPWLGVPLARILAKAGPKPEAKFVAFKSFHNPELAPGQKLYTSYPWPYFEGLRLDEATNELTLAAVGMYGQRLPAQSGTPLRILTPWKYGFKGPKSVVQITLVDRQPKTFWNTAVPAEYKFYSNVDPEVPHPRWSQASEWHLGDRNTQHPTLRYNGYGEQVAKLYDGVPRTLF